MIYYICWFVLPIVLTCCASAYLASLVCPFALWRHWSVRWYFGFVGAIWSSVLALLFIRLGLSLHPGEIGKIDEGEFFVSMFIRLSVFALAPALLVVWYYLRKKREGRCAE